ncbi:MAG: glycosyltransferase family 4 protein [Ilumatobacteraceae bacterium]
MAHRLEREGFDHVHCHFATAACEVARPAALAGRSFTVTAHAKDIFHEDNAPLLSERTLGAAGVVTVSRYNVDHLRTALPGLAIHHVPNGLPLPDVCGVTPGGPVLCVARLVPKKAIDVLLHAIARCRDDVRLELVGDGPQRDELEALANELGIADCVVFAGARSSDEVDAAYRRCSMVVLPCRIDAAGDRDGTPTVLVEAMGRGLPVISSDIVGLAEIVQHGITGLLTPAEDPAALAVAIEHLATDGELAARLGAAGRRLVADQFSPARSAELLCRLFQRAAISSRQGAVG